MNEPPPVLLPSGQPIVWVTWPWLVLLGVDLPDFLHAEAELLRLAAFGEVVFGDELLGQRAARAFGEEDVLAAQLHARLVSRPWAGRRVPTPMSPATTPLTAPSSS